MTVSPPFVVSIVELSTFGSWPIQGSVAFTPALRNRRGFAANNRHAFTGLSVGQAATIHRVTTSAQLNTALTATGNRIIVFERSGTYSPGGIGSTVLVGSGNLWIAGQTAPNPGVTIRGTRIRFNNAQNVLVQHMRFHLTEAWPVAQGSTADAVFIQGAGSTATNIVFDHCNFGFTFDEIYDITAHNSCDVDFIECMFLYPLHCPALRPDQGTADHAHGPRQSYQNVSANVRVSWQGSFIGHNLGRGPRSSTTQLLLANNLHYNHQNRMTNLYGEGGLSVNQSANIVGQIYKNGPNTGGAKPIQVQVSTNPWGVGTGSAIHIADCWWNGTKQADQYSGGMHQETVPTGKRSSSLVASSIPAGWVGWAAGTAAERDTLEAYVLAHCGARPLNRNPSSVQQVASYSTNGGQIATADVAVGACSPSSFGADPNLVQNTQTFTEVNDPWGAHATETNRRKIEVQLLDMAEAQSP